MILRNRVLPAIHNSCAVNVAYKMAGILDSVKQWPRFAAAKLFPVSVETALSCLRPPSSLAVSVTNICNAKCVFCIYPKLGHRATGIMTSQTFHRVISEAKSLGITSLDITPTVGESLIDPNVVDKVREAIKAGMRVVMTSNGILLEDRSIREGILSSGLSEFNISVPDFDATSYEQIYGVNKYRQMLSGVHELLKSNAESGFPLPIKIRIRSSVRPSVVLNREDYLEWIHPFLGAKVGINFTLGYDSWGGAVTEKDLLGIMRFKPKPPEMRFPCVNLCSFAIQYNGDVRMCGCRASRGEDELVVGNINENRLQDILTSDRSKQMVMRFFDGDRPEICKKCELYSPLI